MLAQAILKTIKYFDVQDHCLTLLEFAKFLPNTGDPNRHFSLPEIEDALKKELGQQVAEKSGFYFLRGREALVAKRLQNNFYAAERLKRCKKYLPGIRFVPFISAAALSGSEAIANSKKGSDIDLLVLTQKNRMWLGRLTLSFYFQVLGLRRHGNLIENRFCLNHYIEQGKILRGDQNLYTAVEYVSLVPFFGGAEIYRFQQDNLGWIKNYLAQPLVVRKDTPLASGFKRGFEWLLNNRFGNWLEALAGRYQLRRIKIQDYITVQNDELSFHPGSKGQQVLKKAGL